MSTFWLDDYEVTVARFRRFVNAYDAWHVAGNPKAGAAANPAIAGSGWDSTFTLPADAVTLRTSLQCHADYSTWSESGNDVLPINCVDWFTAFAFCAWDGGRLPTQSEWQYAAMGGTNGFLYPWGNTPVPDNAGNVAPYAVYRCLGEGTTECTFADILPVGSRPLGRGLFGQYDLAGSMGEWMLDWDAPYPTEAKINYAQLEPGEYRVRRGGSWNGFATHLSNNYAFFPFPPLTRDVRYGFRCARNP